MKIKYLKISKYKNLEDIELSFETELVTLFVGKNGLGKSNLLEALAFIFSSIDLADKESYFTENSSIDFFDFTIKYRCKNHDVQFSFLEGVLDIQVKHKDQTEFKTIPFNHFNRDKSNYTPDYVIGYYSGENSRIKKFFSRHKEKRISNIKRYDNDLNFPALGRMFFTEENCGELLFFTLSVFRNSKTYKRKINNLLYNYLDIDKKSKVNIAFNNPEFYKNYKDKNVDNLLSNSQEKVPNIFWGITGRIDNFLLALYNNHLYKSEPVAFIDKDEDSRQNVEEFIFFNELNYDILVNELPESLKDPIHFFDILHSAYELGIIYNIYGELVKNGQLLVNSYSELSEGEQQLLTVLGLILIAGRDDCLFLLDEPDTHLNPRWQRDLMEHLKEFNINDDNSHIFLATHSPLIVQSVLEQDDVFMFKKVRDKIYIEKFEHKIENWRVDQVLLSSLFDLDSVRPKQLDSFMKKRLDIIRKGNLTEQDRTELKALENEMGYLPTGETIDEIESLTLIKKVADLNKKI